MFSGIISRKAKVKNVIREKNSLDVSIEMPKGISIEEGESINLNGICSTVVTKNKKEFIIHYMKETLNKTKAGEIVKNSELNFEQSLLWKGKISGHFVSGHIDCIGIVKNVDKKKGWVMQIQIPSTFAKYVVYKGSITVDGVALTVSKKDGSSFEVSLIPYTLSHTTLSSLKKGDKVNIETDLLAKYLSDKFLKRKKKKA